MWTTFFLKKFSIMMVANEKNVVILRCLFQLNILRSPFRSARSDACQSKNLQLNNQQEYAFPRSGL